MPPHADFSGAAGLRQLGWRAGSHARSAPSPKTGSQSAPRPQSRCPPAPAALPEYRAAGAPPSTTAKFAIADVRLTVGASGRLCARQESKGSRTEVERHGKSGSGASSP